MKRTASIVMLFVAALSVGAYALSKDSEKAEIGKVSPNFTVDDSNGKSMSLSDYRGKYVVLEWTNNQCPFVQKHYNSGNMQAAQEKARAMGAVWLTIDSSGPGAPGYLTPAEVNQYRVEHKVKSAATLIDSKGTVGRIYNARTTPQIVVMDPKGVVIYNGAIDDRPSPDPDSLKGARNYALDALKESMAGKEVSVSTSRPYGCGIKYANE
jgi:hypothetical protein